MINDGQQSPPSHLDLYGRSELWEEPLRLRPYRRTLEPLPPRIANSDNTKRMIAWLVSYHQAHTWQLQEALGVSPYAMSRLARPLYLAGLVARGRPRLYGAGAVPYVYQLHDGAPFRAWLRSLCYADWLGVTGGTKVVFASYHHRHNMLVGDLALTAARTLSHVQVVLGEQYTAAPRMVPDCPHAALGDMAMVTSSGLRIVIELTANTSDSLERKVQRWGKIMVSRDAADLGMVVILLNAAQQYRRRRVGKMLRQLVARSLGAAQLANNGTWLSDREVGRARAGIMVAEWDNWFNASGHPTLSFAHLEASRSLDGHTFTQVPALTSPFTPRDPSIWQAPLANVSYLYGVPQVLRQRHIQPAPAISATG